MAFLPITLENEKPFDFVYISGDAYVDHPSFGMAIITRLLENHGYSIGILSQPDWKDASAFAQLGKPTLGFLVSSGNIDSMVNHYTVAKKRRAKDLYSPGGQAGLRPDRAVAVYCNKIKEVFRDVPIIIGGMEASLRRLSHYDYWDNQVRRSLLLDASADLLIYGMGEHQIVEIASQLAQGTPVSQITNIRGTVYRSKECPVIENSLFLPTFLESKLSKAVYAKSFLMQYQNTDAIQAKTLIEEYKEGFIVQNPPAYPLSRQELDDVSSLPYMRNYHPTYEALGGVPAISEVKFSLVHNRGCFGSCNFCALTFHQGRVVTSRSHASLLTEGKLLTAFPDFKGYIHDVGGPTANFRDTACQQQLQRGVCSSRTCLSPQPCPHLRINHSDYVSLLRKLRDLPGVKKVFIRSGIRYDYAIYDKDDTFLKELCQYHISGQLKVAPEHVAPEVLEKMGKPRREIFDRFTEKYQRLNDALGKKQFLVPYLMSSHPGSTLHSAIALAEYIRDTGRRPEQVQDFYPTPGTLSTCMYYTGMDPRDGTAVYVPKNPHEKAMQRALIQYFLPQNYELVLEALHQAGRQDLIGFTSNCLIRPRKPKQAFANKTAFEKKAPNKPFIKKKTIRNLHKKKA